MNQPATRQSEFWAGVKATLPLVVGAIPFGIIFGALAGSSGLSSAGTIAMSMLVFAGSAQFIATSLIAHGATALIIILTTFVVNLRHALYSASLAPYMKHLPQRWLFPLAFWLTDESFVVVIAHYSDETDSSPFKHWYFLGSAVFMYTNWIACTVIGVIAGQSIKDPQNWGLDFAMVATFIGILIPFIKTRPALISVMAAGFTAILTYSLPNRLGLIIAALVGVIAGVAAESIWSSQPDTPIDTPMVIAEGE